MNTFECLGSLLIQYDGVQYCQLISVLQHVQLIRANI